MSLDLYLLQCVNEGRLAQAALIGPKGEVVGEWVKLSVVQPALRLYGMKVQLESQVSGAILHNGIFTLATNWFSATRWMRPVDTMNCLFPLEINERAASLYNELAAKIVSATVPPSSPVLSKMAPALPEGVKRVLDL